MHCNLRAPEPHQPFPALVTTSCQVWSRWTYPLPCYRIFCCWRITLRCDLDLWPLTLNICIVSSVTWWGSVPILTQSNNPRRSYCNFSVWPYDLEHVLSVALGSEIIFTKFDLRQLIRVWFIAFLRLICYDKLWPWPLMRWPWKFVAHEVSRDKSLYEIWAKSSNSRLNYW